MLVLTRSEVEELLDLDALVGALARAHEELSSGAVSMPPRIAALTDKGLLGAMPAYLPSAGLGCKLVTLFPHNSDRPTHQAAIVLFDPASGTPVVLIDGTYVTETRMAAAVRSRRACSRVTTRARSRSSAPASRRARTLRAFAGIRDWAEIRSPAATRRRRRRSRPRLGAVAADSFEDAVRGADVVAATTHSHEPVVRRSGCRRGRT